MEIYLGLILSKISHIPYGERPREKALRYGIEKISDNELIAIIIGSGYKDCSAIEIADHLLRESNGINKLLDRSVSDLLRYKGIGKVTALRLGACFELIRRYLYFQFDFGLKFDTDSLYQKYYPQLKLLTQEVVVLIVLNHRRKIIYEETLYKGCSNSVLLDPKAIVEKVILQKGKSFYIIHNHPSGNSTPSTEDMIATSELIIAANHKNICFIDHLIIGKDGYYSFEKGKTSLIDER